jgi:hypothetical protein
VLETAEVSKRNFFSFVSFCDLPFCHFSILALCHFSILPLSLFTILPFCYHDIMYAVMPFCQGVEGLYGIKQNKFMKNLTTKMQMLYPRFDFAQKALLSEFYWIFINTLLVNLGGREGPLLSQLPPPPSSCSSMFLAIPNFFLLFSRPNDSAGSKESCFGWSDELHPNVWRSSGANSRHSGLNRQRLDLG